MTNAQDAAGVAAYNIMDAARENEALRAENKKLRTENMCLRELLDETKEYIGILARPEKPEALFSRLDEALK